VQGKLNKQIAADLGIHERTVKLHRTHLTTKLGVHSVAELTRMVQAAGVFPAGTSDQSSVVSHQ
jgi:FixJ family two-component response regulator